MTDFQSQYKFGLFSFVGGAVCSFDYGIIALLLFVVNLGTIVAISY